jgi:hypothetical protein
MGSLIPEDVADGPVSAAIKDMLLVGGQHGSGIAGGGKLTRQAGPVVVMDLIGRCVPEDVVDGPVGTAIEDVLLGGVGGQQGCGVARGGRCRCTLGPIVAVELLRRRIPENVLNCAVAAPIENVLLVGVEGYQGRRVAGRGRRSRTRRLVILVELVGGCVPKYMLDCPARGSVENVLLAGIDSTQSGGAAGRAWSSRSLGPVIAIDSVCRSVPKDMLDVATGTWVKNV